MKDYYRESLEKIKNFYTGKTDAKTAQTKIFETLYAIIPFENGKISFLNGNDTDTVYSVKKNETCKFYIQEPLCVDNLQYGVITIGRNKRFSSREITAFKTCASVISNIIKEIEMSSIVETQLNMLRQGIQRKSSEYKRAVEADRIKNKFIANVSHELRSPLNSIIGFTDLLYKQLPGKLNDKQLEYIDDIRIASLHLLNMVNEILDISKLESGTMKLNLSRFNLYINIQEVLNILEPLYLKKNLQITVETDKFTEITADYPKIQQILLNLVGNSIKFTPNGGNILIRVSNSKKYTTISVKDNGCGINPKFHKTIFNKFEQISQTSNSTGLGLTITRELVKLHNGKIYLKSDEGLGAEFIIKIPVI